jgi:hypothetical protein
MNAIYGGRLARLTGLLTVILVISAGLAVAAVRHTKLASVSAQSGGVVSVYGYNTGATVTHDVAAEWDAGVYNNTAKTSDGGRVELARSGDVAPDATHAWWDTAWRTRRCWTVTNATAAVATPGRVTLSFDTAADIAAGRMQATGADIRAASGGSTPSALTFNAAGPFPSAASVVTVEVPSLAAGASTPVCLYWGNALAPSASVTLNAGSLIPTFRIYADSAAGGSIADPVLAWSPTGALPAGVAAAGTVTPTLVTGATLPAGQTSASVEPGTPNDVFTRYMRADLQNGAQTSGYNFTVAAGTNVVLRAYFSDQTTQLVNFNGAINGTAFLPADYRPSTVCTGLGLTARCALMATSAQITSTGNVQLRFSRGPGNNAVRDAIWSAIEVLRIAPPVSLTATGGTRREGLLPPSGTWTSATVDTGAVGTIFGVITPTSSLANPAVGKPVTASPVAATFELAAANDGTRTGTRYRSTSVGFPFWEVDLLSTQNISSVTFHTQTAAMANVRVFVSPTPLSGFATPADAVAAGIPHVFFPGFASSVSFTAQFPASTAGRYVRIWSGTNGTAVDLFEVEVDTGTPSDVMLQVAASNNPAGPWVFVGPNGTAATSWTSAGAFPYAADGNRYYQVRATFLNVDGISSPVLDTVRTGHSLSVLPRSVDGFHLFGGSAVGVNWAVRIKTDLATVSSAATATLHPQDTSSWGTSQISGYLDRLPAGCCIANSPFFSTTGLTVDPTPVGLHDVGGFRNLSVINVRSNDLPVGHEQIVDIGLSPTVHLQIPLRRSAGIPTNIALGKTASQSSTDFGGLAARTNDDNTNGNYLAGASVNHTGFQVRPWWQVDLGSQRLVNSVEVYNRTDCCTNRLNAFYIVVSSNPLPATFSLAALSAPGVSFQTYSGGPFTTPQTLTFPGGATGRYVRLWSQDTNYLHVAEVKVMGPA